MRFIFRPNGSTLRPSAALATTVLVLCALLGSAPLRACPWGGSAPPPTLHDEVVVCDVAVFCRLLLEREQPEWEPLRFEVTEVLKGRMLLPERPLDGTPGHRFTTHAESLDDGDEYLVFGKMDWSQGNIAWGSAKPVSSRARSYLRCVASFSKTITDVQRLKQILPFVDAPDALIATDLDEELKRIEYSTLRQARDELPALKLREWIADATTSPRKLENCLTMLSVCGSSRDLPLLQSVLERSDSQYLDAQSRAIACYLIVGGDDGLAWIENKYLTFGEDRRPDQNATQAAFAALRFVSRQTGALPRTQIVAAFRRFLDDPQFAGLPTFELIRLRDWESAPRLMAVFHWYHASDKADDRQWAKLPIVNYMRASPRADAKKYLDEIEKLDPEVVKKSKAYYPLPGL